MPRYIDVDAFRKENRMAEHCEDCERNSRECQYNDFSMMDFCGWLDDAPTVDAVPLDKLCEWLANVAELPAPCYYLSDYCRFDDFGHCELDEPVLAECWKRTLKKWMEEQDAN